MKIRARSFDPTLDHQNIWLWIQACNIKHADRCIATPATGRRPSDSPDWVIDTTAACLVPGSAVDKYVALSYVWPSPSVSPADTLLLERATLPQFRTPGFFLDNDNISRIPQVIQDAVRLAQGFGERFVWVDRLCLLQNDNETYTQVQKMHEIYWGAYITIIAATSGGIYGRDDCPKPSSPDQERNDFPLQHANDNSTWATYHLALMNEHYARLSRSKWGTRGWTYQEKILSRRTIILLDDDMFWDCQCALWDCNGLDPFTETPTQQGSDDGHNRLNMRLTPHTSVDFSLYVELICPYNARDLSYAQDVVPAFTGILNTLAPAFPDGFAAGIPLAYLNNLLLWQPRQSAVRREGTSNPSWSWTGWRCEIDPWSLRSGLATVTDQPSALQRAGSWLIREAVDCVVVSPEASWRVSAGQAQHGQVEVEQDGAVRFKCTSNDGSTSFSDSVPLGSVPREVPPVDALLFVQTSSASFRVRAKASAPFREPPEAEVHFRELVAKPPKPVPQSCSAGGLFGAVPFGAPSATFGSMSKVSVYESSFSTSLDSIGESASLMLSDTLGRFAGVVRMLDDCQLLGSDVELIALSLGSVRYRDLDAEYEERWQQERSQDSQPMYEGNSPPFSRLCSLLATATVPASIDSGESPSVSHLPRPFQKDTSIGAFQRGMCLEDDGVFEFYNVLLITQKGDIAYRRGCGRVPKKVWEQNALPAQRFVLG